MATEVSGDALLAASVLKAYDSMPRQRWRGFEAYCLTNELPTSLLSFVEYLTVYAERSESVEYRELTALQVAQQLRDALRMVLPLAEEYLKKAPTHPDNAKLETARAALRRARDTADMPD